MGSSPATKIQKCQLCHLLLCYKEWAVCLSSEGWRGVFQPISLPTASGPVREEALPCIPFPSFSCWAPLASRPSCQAAWNLPWDSCTAQETLVLNLASQIPFWGWALNAYAWHCQVANLYEWGPKVFSAARSPEDRVTFSNSPHSVWRIPKISFITEPAYCLKSLLEQMCFCRRAVSL